MSLRRGPSGSEGRGPRPTLPLGPRRNDKHPMFTAPDSGQRDEFLLAPYAMATRFSRGRQYPEPEHPFRPLFQRDRERVVHSSAFRRLMLKTQVLAAATNDHHRT